MCVLFLVAQLLVCVCLCQCVSFAPTENWPSVKAANKRSLSQLPLCRNYKLGTDRSAVFPSQDWTLGFLSLFSLPCSKCTKNGFSAAPMLCLRLLEVFPLFFFRGRRELDVFFATSLFSGVLIQADALWMRLVDWDLKIHVFLINTAEWEGQLFSFLAFGLHSVKTLLPHLVSKLAFFSLPRQIVNKPNDWKTYERFHCSLACRNVHPDDCKSSTVKQVFLFNSFWGFENSIGKGNLLAWKSLLIHR